MNILIAALILAETEGVPNPPPGDHGKAFGPLQIHQEVVDDVNRHYGTKYRLIDVNDIRVARWVCSAYISIYATPKAIGRSVTDQDRARIWNGGPKGWKKKSTIRYWRKVERKMKVVKIAEFSPSWEMARAA